MEYHYVMKEKSSFLLRDLEKCLNSIICLNTISITNVNDIEGNLQIYQTTTIPCQILLSCSVGLQPNLFSSKRYQLTSSGKVIRSGQSFTGIGATIGCCFKFQCCNVSGAYQEMFWAFRFCYMRKLTPYVRFLQNTAPRKLIPRGHH